MKTYISKIFTFLPTMGAPYRDTRQTVKRLNLWQKTAVDKSAWINAWIESTFVEITNPTSGANVVVGTIYKDPSVDLADFKRNCLNNLLEKKPKQQKSVCLSGDFNINFLNHNVHNLINEDSLASNIFFTLPPEAN